VRNAAQYSSTLIKSHVPNPSSETLQNENVIMPKAKRTKVNWNKLFKKINSERKKLRSENSPNHLEHQAPCSVLESARQSAESKASGVVIVFESKPKKAKEPVLITIDSDENEDSVNSMGSSLVCDSALQHNPGGWYCSVASWTSGNTCRADVLGTYSSEVPSRNEAAAFKTMQSGDASMEHSSTQAGRYLSMCNHYSPRPHYCILEELFPKQNNRFCILFHSAFMN
jgi:hypothetical protein